LGPSSFRRRFTSAMSRRSSEPCQLVDGKKLVHGDAVAQRAIFLSPGDHNLIAGFGEGRTQAKTVTAAAGARSSIPPPGPSRSSKRSGYL